jgi:hypothetical protein
MVTLTIDGRRVSVEDGTTVLAAAERAALVEDSPVPRLAQFGIAHNEKLFQAQGRLYYHRQSTMPSRRSGGSSL